MNNLGNNAPTSKWKNRRLILNLIHSLKSTSRIELSKLTNLTKPTISTIVNNFLEEGLVIETTLSDSKSGRKAMMLEINYSHYFIISININDNIMKISLSDLSSKIHYFEEYFINKSLGNDLFINTLKEIIYNFYSNNIPDIDLIIGIGISINGIVDIENGICIEQNFLNLKNLCIKNLLENVLNIPIFVENSTYSTSLILLNKYSNFLYLNISNTINISKILNNKIYRTSSISNSEIGDFRISKTTYLKDICTTSILAEKFINTKSIYIKNPLNNKDILSLLYQTIQLGDINSINLLKDFCNNLELFLNNYILLFNPEKIIIDGDITIIKNYIADYINIECLCFNELNELSSLEGTATLVSTEFFSNYI